MKKIILFILVLLISAYLFSQDNKELGQQENTDLLSPHIKYFKPDDVIKYPASGYISKVKEEDNYIIAIKQGDKNHVKVVLRINGFTYPELDDIKQLYLRNYKYYIGKKSGKYGAIDEQGKILIPFVFDYYFNLALENDYTPHNVPSINQIKEELNYEKYLFDYNYFYIYNKESDNNILVPIITGSQYRYADIYEDYKIGIADKKGNIIIDCEYPFLNIINDKYIYAGIFEERDFAAFMTYLNSDLGKGLNINFKSCVPGTKRRFISGYNYILSDFKEDYIIRDIKRGVIDYKTHVVIPFEYSRINLVYDKYFVCEKENKSGVLSKDNRVLVPFEYDSLEPISDKYIIVSERNYNSSTYNVEIKRGIIDYNNNILVPMEYASLTPFNDKYIYATGEKGKGIIDYNNKVLIPLEYSDLEIINDKYIYAEKNDVSGIIDYNNKVVIPFKYTCGHSVFHKNGIYYIDDSFICANVKDKFLTVILDINNNILHEIKNYVMPIYKKDVNTNEKKFSKDYLISLQEGVYDLEGKYYGELKRIEPYGIITTSSRNLYILNKNKNVLLIKGCDNIINVYPNAYVVLKFNHKENYGFYTYGLVDKKGNIVVDVLYDKIIYPIYSDKSNNKGSTFGDKPKSKRYEYIDPSIYDNKDFKFIAFSNKDNSVLVNLDTLKTTGYDREIVGLDNEGNVYVREPSEDTLGAFSIVPYKE